MDDEDERTIVDLLVDQVDFADVILLNKIDQVDEAKKAEIISGIRALNPRAAELVECSFGKIDPSAILNTGRFDIQSAEQMPDWLKLIQNEPVPEPKNTGSAISFTEHAALPSGTPLEMDEAGLAGVIRSKGFLLARHTHGLRRAAVSSWRTVRCPADRRVVCCGCRVSIGRKTKMRS